MIYEIKGKLLEVTNEIKELDEYIFGRFSQFRKVKGKETSNFLKIKEDSVEILIEGQKKVLKNKIIKTDIYPIVNNIIAYLINDKHNILIHGIVVSKNNEGILIVGDFGQGKSTLATEFKNNGYEINSTDQTWIEEKQGKIYQKVGSRFDIENGKIKILDNDIVMKKIRIKRIMKITGLCNNGDVSLNIINNEYYTIKNLAYFSNWSYLMPIFTDDIELYNITKYTKQFLKNMVNTDIQVLDIRGDKKKILEKLGEIK